jgi:hypothetical protein
MRIGVTLIIENGDTNRVAAATVALLCLGGLNSFAQPTPPAGKQWVIVPALTDDFHSFDPTKWQTHHPYWDGRPPSVFDTNNVSFTNGMLHLQMTLADTNQQGNWIHAACLTSRTRAFTEGMYAETRVKIASLCATSSFWMQGDYSEIDVIENFGTVKNRAFNEVPATMMSNTHYFPHGWADDVTAPLQTPNPNHQLNADRYFTYGVWWQDERTVIFYRDGAAVGKVTTGGNFHEPMYLFFDMEPMSWGPGLPNAAEVADNHLNTASFQWVHTWVLK